MEKSLIKLQQVSEMAKKFTDINKLNVATVYYGAGMDDFCTEFSFHPNGKCGCIGLKDENFLGIRCNHLMWAEGSCEGWDFCFKDKDYNDETYKNVIIIYGNDKGCFTLSVIFYEF